MSPFRVGQWRSIGAKIENICSHFGKLGAYKRSLSIFHTKTIVRFLFYPVVATLCKHAPLPNECFNYYLLINNITNRIAIITFNNTNNISPFPFIYILFYF